MPDDVFDDEPLGFECKAYLNSASHASPTWGEMKHMRSGNVNETWSEADASRRGFGSEKVSRPARITREITFQILPKKSDPVYVAIRNAAHARTFLEFAFMNGSITTPGNEGLRGTFCITNFSRNEADEDQVWMDVTLKVAPSANLPTWYVVPDPEDP